MNHSTTPSTSSSCSFYSSCSSLLLCLFLLFLPFLFFFRFLPADAAELDDDGDNDVDDDVDDDADEEDLELALDVDLDLDFAEDKDDDDQGLTRRLFFCRLYAGLQWPRSAFLSAFLWSAFFLLISSFSFLSSFLGDIAAAFSALLFSDNFFPFVLRGLNFKLLELGLELELELERAFLCDGFAPSDELEALRPFLPCSSRSFLPLALPFLLISASLLDAPLLLRRHLRCVPSWALRVRASSGWRLLRSTFTVRGFLLANCASCSRASQFSVQSSVKLICANVTISRSQPSASVHACS